MKIEDRREIKDYKILDHVISGGIVQFKSDKENDIKIFWIKTNDEKNDKVSCVDIVNGSIKQFNLNELCFTVNACCQVLDNDILDNDILD